MIGYDTKPLLKHSRSLLQRISTYVYDSWIVPYIAQTYSTTTTLIVITGAYRPEPSPTTTDRSHKQRNRQSDENPNKTSRMGHLSVVLDAHNPLRTYTYDTTAAANGLSACYAQAGNIIEYVTADSTIAAHYEYDAFGNTTQQSGSEANNFPFRFSTKYLDETGLYYYGYRYYSPELGRWVSRDPIQERGGLNVYASCGNSLLFLYDVLGLVADEDLLKLLEILMAFKSNCPTYGNWDAGITMTLELMDDDYSDLLSAFASEVSSGISDSMSGVDNYQEWVHDLYEGLYPDDGLDLGDLPDFGEFSDKMGKLKNAIDIVHGAAIAGGNPTPGQLAELLSITLDVSTSLFGLAPGMSSFITFYTDALSAISSGIDQIDSDYFSSGLTILQNLDCCDLESALISAPTAALHGTIKDIWDATQE